MLLGFIGFLLGKRFFIRSVVLLFSFSLRRHFFLPGPFFSAIFLILFFFSSTPLWCRSLRDADADADVFCRRFRARWLPLSWRRDAQPPRPPRLFWNKISIFLGVCLLLLLIKMDRIDRNLISFFFKYLVLLSSFLWNWWVYISGNLLREKFFYFLKKKKFFLADWVL